MSRQDQPMQDGSIGFWEATSIGVGGMIGGGIFAILGLAVGVGEGGTFIAFFVAGMVALVTTYSYVRLSVTMPSAGGTVRFLNEGFGVGRLSGSLSVLLWISYLVTISLYAYAFGSYGATLLPESLQAPGAHVLITTSLLVMAVLNIFSAKLVGETEDYIVGGKVLILVAFVVAALFATDLGASAPSSWAGPGPLIAGGMLIFVAYEGFELIANSAADVREPEKNLPRAFYSSVIFTIVLYMLVAIAIVGLLSLTEIADAADFALAEAAQMLWGTVGFNLIVVAALLSTASAINATLYGTSRLSVTIASDGELPALLERKIGGKPLFGMLGTAAGAVLMANLIPLASISSLASAGFLIVFAAVNVANARLFERTGSSRWISVLGAIACVGALFALIGHIAQNRPHDLILLAALLVTTFAGESAYRRLR